MPAPHHSVFYRPDALPVVQQHKSTEGTVSAYHKNIFAWHNKVVTSETLGLGNMLLREERKPKRRGMSLA